MISVLEAKNDALRSRLPILLSRPGIAPPLFRAVGTPLAAARTRLSSAHEKGRPEAAFLGFA
ncbi:hypothetical protein [Pseudomonas aeruginosa]|uniref:hypothetical protein n=1 Tax=Pseudomonas aeruginosa TaxID=287 RepID=UPI0010472987|nr:hypothetical protein [Pseudomonas aeruginosa]